MIALNLDRGVLCVWCLTRKAEGAIATGLPSEFTKGGEPMDIIRQYVSEGEKPRRNWLLFLTLLVIDVCLIVSAMAQGTEATLTVLKLLH
jgi:hypothetical protein